MGKNTKIIGYTTGVFDLFHVGHVNILRNAKSLCDYLIVGISTNKLVKEYKNKIPVIPFEQRMEVIKSCRYVDAVVPQIDMNKLEACKQLKVNKLFVGGWYGTDKWNKIEEDLKKVGVDVIYFPYTEGTSSTMINDILDKKRAELSKEILEKRTE